MSISQRPGCLYCFESFDPTNLQTIACVPCQATYHLECWNRLGRCFHCNSDQYQAAPVSRVAPLVVTTKQEALPIRRSGLAFSAGAVGLAIPDYLYQQLLMIANADAERYAAVSERTTANPSWRERLKVGLIKFVHRALPLLAWAAVMIVLGVKTAGIIAYQAAVRLARWGVRLISQINKTR